MIQSLFAILFILNIKLKSRVTRSYKDNGTSKDFPVHPRRYLCQQDADSGLNNEAIYAFRVCRILSNLFLNCSTEELLTTSSGRPFQTFRIL